jgi:hypothetical protein
MYNACYLDVTRSYAATPSHTIPAINNIASNNANPPQNGAVTHHHDQSITPHNFSVTKTTPSKSRIPIPPDEPDDLESDISSTPNIHQITM